MTPGQPEGPRRPQPGQRALGAMELAVQRARASQGLERPPGGGDPRPLPPAGVPPAGARSTRGQHGGQHGGNGTERQRWLAAAVAVVALLVAGSGIALAVSSGHGPGTPTPGAVATTVPGPTGGSAPTTTTSPKGSGSSTTTTTAAPPTPGAPPQISSVSPTSGSPGQTLTVSGANFISADGSIVASFDGRITATSCATPSVCTVTVPPPSAGQTSAQLTITTASGTSNAIAFSYR